MRTILFSLLLFFASFAIAACEGEVTAASGEETTTGGDVDGAGSSRGDTCSPECLACCNDPKCPLEEPYAGAVCSSDDDGLLCYYDDGVCEHAWSCGIWEFGQYGWAPRFEQIHCPAPYVPDCRSAKDGDACPYPDASCGGYECDTFSAFCGDDHVWQITQLPCEAGCDC